MMWFTARIIRQSDDIFTTSGAKPWFVFYHDLKHNIPFMVGLGAICKIHKIVLHLCWNDIHCFVNEFDELCKCRSDASAVLDSTLSKVCLLGIHLWFSSHIHCLSRWFHVWFRVSITVARKPDDCQVRTWDLNMGSLQLSTPTASHNGSACCFSSSFVKLNHVYFEKHYYFIFKNTCFEQMGEYYEQIKIHSGFPRFDTA